MRKFIPAVIGVLTLTACSSMALFTSESDVTRCLFPDDQSLSAVIDGYIRADKLDDAEYQVSRLSKNKQASYYIKLAELRFNAGDEHAALNLYQKAGLSEADAYSRLGGAALALKRIEDAAAYYRRAQNKAGLQKTAAQALQEGDADGAEAIYTELGDRSGLIKTAEFLLKKKEYERAAALLLQAGKTAK
jgi:tetratricopeptide (TPR) repeat protein